MGQARPSLTTRGGLADSRFRNQSTRGANRRVQALIPPRGKTPFLVRGISFGKKMTNAFQDGPRGLVHQGARS